MRFCKEHWEKEEVYKTLGERDSGTYIAVLDWRTFRLTPRATFANINSNLTRPKIMTRHICDGMPDAMLTYK